MRSLCLALLLASMLAATARAQTLPDTTLAYPERGDAQLGAAVSLSQGPFTVMQASADQLGRLQLPRQRLELAASQAFGESDGDRFVRDLRGFARYRVSVLRYERAWLPDLSIAALGIFERSEPQRHELLSSTGLALDLTVVRTKGLRLSMTGGYVFEREVFSKLTRDDIPTRQVRDSQLAIWSHRTITGLELGFEPASWLHVGERIFAFMPLDHCRCDTKVENTLFLRMLAPSSVFAFQFEAGALYDPRPAVRATQLRTLVRSSLILHFR